MRKKYFYIYQQHNKITAIWPAPIQPFSAVKLRNLLQRFEPLGQQKDAPDPPPLGKQDVVSSTSRTQGHGFHPNTTLG